MDFKDIKAVYFIGAGGIGMSAIARYFLYKGLDVAGYDRTPSNLTRELEKEGMPIHYEENIDAIPQTFRNPRTTLVVFTPAVSADHKELAFFRENGFNIESCIEAAWVATLFSAEFQRITIQTTSFPTRAILL